MKTNLEAAAEIMRQLRLRDVGGIIVVDFIDMKMERHKRDVERVVRDESRRDRSQMVILPMSQFCLMQIARQKTRPSVQSVSHEPCPACGGTGFVKSTASIGLEIVRALKSTLDRADVAGFLRSKKAEMEEMEAKYKKRIRVNVAKDLPPNRVEFACYNDAGEKVLDFVK